MKGGRTERRETDEGRMIGEKEEGRGTGGSGKSEREGGREGVEK